MPDTPLSKKARYTNPPTPPPTPPPFTDTENQTLVVLNSLVPLITSINSTLSVMNELVEPGGRLLNSFHSVEEGMKLLQNEIESKDENEGGEGGIGSGVGGSNATME